MTHSPENLGRPVVGVGALLFRADGAVLIGHRIKQGEPESWCLPGGHVESRESFEEAALRELAEETGIHAAEDAEVFALAIDMQGGRMTAGVAARVEQADAVTREPDVFDRWIWARLDDLPSPLFPASAALLHAWCDRPPAPGWVLYSMTRSSVDFKVSR
ncbi:NUDIX domain-containing protein [Polyangium sp. 6x1]|uniref:nucleotide triphosphate diphosphatase NUDT15 n=1 Tax=Polyangium sp. 6x1 TaxID=3042689 RepID=UPI00248272A1|nr:NUDIX domain-containing protein [Polyangium sp. 6x1]MDI1449754.1 NUDIX domain-containing protein [Polyangium sp. 6x1]